MCGNIYIHVSDPGEWDVLVANLVNNGFTWNDGSEIELPDFEDLSIYSVEIHGDTLSFRSFPYEGGRTISVGDYIGGLGATITTGSHIFSKGLIDRKTVGCFQEETSALKDGVKALQEQIRERDKCVKLHGHLTESGTFDIEI